MFFRKESLWYISKFPKMSTTRQRRGRERKEPGFWGPLWGRRESCMFCHQHDVKGKGQVLIRFFILSATFPHKKVWSRREHRSGSNEVYMTWSKILLWYTILTRESRFFRWISQVWRVRTMSVEITCHCVMNSWHGGTWHTVSLLLLSQCPSHPRMTEDSQFLEIRGSSTKL
jgi:hypothetical protein